MKKIFTLLTAFAMTVGAYASTSWQADANVAKAPGQMYNTESDCPVFIGSGLSSFKKNSDAAGYTGFLEGKTDISPKYNPSTPSVPTAGAYVYFTPSKPGTIELACVINGGKKLYLTDATGVNITDQASFFDKDGNAVTNMLEGAFSPEAKLSGAVLKFDVEANKTYYAFCSGSKISVYGYIFTEKENEGPVMPAAPISWSESKVSFKVRDAIPTMPVLVNEENLDVTFSSSNEALATVSETGVITVNENVEGAAIISATAGDGVTYKETVATCTIEVLTNKVVEKAAAPYETREIKMTKMLVKAADALTAGAIFGEDENLTVLAPYAAKVNNETATIFNREFTKRLDVRVTAEPTAEVPEGTEKAGATSLVFKPAVDLTLVVFGRRQSVEDKSLLSVVDDETNNIITETHFYNMTATDGKQLRFANQADPAVMLDHEVVIDSYQSNLDYGYVASIIKLKAGEVYTAWGFNTTYGVMGIGYIIEPAAPVAKLDGASVDWKGEDIAIDFELAAAHHQLYYKFTAAQAPVEELMAKAVDHTGYELAEANKVTVAGPGTLSVYAYDPNTDIKSEPVEITVNDGTSAIDQIGADVNAPVEYFNLQGIRVDNPENGVFIRRQGTTVTKVVK